MEPLPAAAPLGVAAVVFPLMPGISGFRLAVSFRDGGEKWHFV
jgi:hypothetical protein